MLDPVLNSFNLAHHKVENALSITEFLKLMHLNNPAFTLVEQLFEKACADKAFYTDAEGQVQPLILNVIYHKVNRLKILNDPRALRAFLEQYGEDLNVPEAIKRSLYESAYPLDAKLLRGADAFDVLQKRFLTFLSPDEFHAFLVELYQAKATYKHASGVERPLVYLTYSNGDRYSIPEDEAGFQAFYNSLQQRFGLREIVPTQMGMRTAAELAILFLQSKSKKAFNAAMQRLFDEQVTYATKTGETKPLIVLTNNRSSKILRLNNDVEAYEKFFELLGEKLKLSSQRLSVLKEGRFALKGDFISMLELALDFTKTPLEYSFLKQKAEELFEQNVTTPSGEPLVYFGFDGVLKQYFVKADETSVRSFFNCLGFNKRTKNELSLSFSYDLLPSQKQAPRQGMVPARAVDFQMGAHPSFYHLMRHAFHTQKTFVGRDLKVKPLVEVCATPMGYDYFLNEDENAPRAFLQTYQNMMYGKKVRKFVALCNKLKTRVFATAYKKRASSTKPAKKQKAQQTLAPKSVSAEKLLRIQRQKYVHAVVVAFNQSLVCSEGASKTYFVELQNNQLCVRKGFLENPWVLGRFPILASASKEVLGPVFLTPQELSKAKKVVEKRKLVEAGKLGLTGSFISEELPVLRPVRSKIFSYLETAYHSKRTYLNAQGQTKPLVFKGLVNGKEMYLLSKEPEACTIFYNEFVQQRYKLAFNERYARKRFCSGKFRLRD